MGVDRDERKKAPRELDLRSQIDQSHRSRLVFDLVHNAVIRQDKYAIAAM